VDFEGERFMDFTDAILIIGTNAVVTLLPLVPAYVLFKTLRSHARVNGPFAGLTIHLGGAFAAYFLVFVMLWNGTAGAVESSHYHDWTVAGKVEFDTDGTSPNPRYITSYVKPPTLSVETDGHFEFKVPVQEFANGKIEWPVILMEVGGFEQAVVRLSPKGVEWGAEPISLKHDAVSRSIHLQHPVRLRPSSYGPAAPALSASNDQ
jgi:hypothetical protein